MTHPMIEEAARAMGPEAFQLLEFAYQNHLDRGETEEFARRCADRFHLPRVQKARADALIACQIALKAAAEAANAEMEILKASYVDEGNAQAADRYAARMNCCYVIASRIRALSEQVGQ